MGREQAGYYPHRFQTSARPVSSPCHVNTMSCHRVMSHVGFAEWSKCHTCRHVRCAVRSHVGRCTVSQSALHEPLSSSQCV